MTSSPWETKSSKGLYYVKNNSPKSPDKWINRTSARTFLPAVLNVFDTKLFMYRNHQRSETPPLPRPVLLPPPRRAVQGRLPGVVSHVQIRGRGQQQPQAGRVAALRSEVQRRKPAAPRAELNLDLAPGTPSSHIFPATLPTSSP